MGVFCFTVVFFFVFLTATTLQIFLVMAWVQSEPVKCAVPLRTWAAVLFGIWFCRIFRSCIDTVCCCWLRDPERDHGVPIRVAVKDFFMATLDFLWVVCLGLHLLRSDHTTDELPACADTAPVFFFACKVYVYFHISATLYFWINVIGLRNMLRHLMRRGFLRTSNAAPPHAIESNTVEVKLTQADLQTEPSCPICMEDYILDGEVVVQTKTCRHRFHKQCLRNWLKTARSCPLCRNDLGVCEPIPNPKEVNRDEEEE